MVLYTLTTTNQSGLAMVVLIEYGLMCGRNALFNSFILEGWASPSLLSWRWPWNVAGFWPCQSQPGTCKAGSPSKQDFLTKAIQTTVYDCIRKCVHVSNDFPVQPAQPETPKAGSPSELSLFDKDIQTVVHDLIRRLLSQGVAIPSSFSFCRIGGHLLHVLYYSV